MTGPKKTHHIDPKTGRFTNRRPELMSAMESPSGMLKATQAFLFAKGERAPLHHLPELKPDLAEFQKNDGKQFKYIWLGHSSFLVNFEGTILLFDPVWHNAAPLSFMVRRFQKPIVALEELPKIDAIILSHDHYDHLDSKAMQYFASQTMPVFTTLKVGERLQEYGIAKDRITELDWWQETRFQNLTIAATPSQHFSGRGLGDRNKTLWCSFAIFSDKHRMYFSGDSGFDSHFADIGAKYGPFDISFMENGQYNELWRAVHMLPEEAVQAHIDVKAKWMVPIHWGMFVLSTHTWFEPIERVTAAAAAKSVSVMTPMIGQMVDIDRPPSFEKWWTKR